jgi:predicted SprT family Zn-dependent metalloprotease
MMSPSPRLVEVEVLARQLMAAHQLHGWSFRFNRSKTNMGLCRFDPRIIELSAYFAERNEEAAIRDTILHEIAHALVGPGHGHDAVWRRMCVRVGARPERLSYEVIMPVGRWQAACGCCGMRHHRHRRPKHMKGWFCRRCGPLKGKLSWSDANAHGARE